jgi:succinoglycan biosynthesis transport protein ExoP
MSKNLDLLASLGNRELHEPTEEPIERRMHKPRSVAPPSHGEPEWLRGLHVVQKHWRWSLGFAVLVGACVTVIVSLMKPIYEPTARIEIAPPGSELFSLQGGEGRADSTEYAETQAKNLQSEQLARTVIRKLHLDQNPEFVDERSKSHASSTAADPDQSSEPTPAEAAALRVFQRSVQVQRDTASWLINVSCASHDPRLAALVVNTLVEQFIERDYRIRHDTIVQSTQWLSRQLDDIRTRMQDSNRSLTEFQRESGITASGTESSFDQKMAELNRQLMAAQADRIELEALLAKVNGKPLPQTEADPVVQEVSKKLATTRADLKQAEVVYGTKHPKVQELHAQLDELEKQLEVQQNSLLTNLRTKYGAAHTRENLLNSELKDARKEISQMAEYEALKREARANEDLYNVLYTKVKEAGISAESKSSGIRWVDRAPVMDRPTRPRRLLDIGLGLLAGLLGGIFLAFVREGLDTKIHTVGDMKSWTGLSNISMMPLAGVVDAAANGGLRPVPVLLRRRDRSIESPLFLLDRPRSAEAQALHALFNAVQLSQPARPPRVLLVASALPSEGKTTIASNLAIALSRHGSTCIVDADLRKAGLAKVFGAEYRRGLADVLDNSCTLDEALILVPGVPNLTLLAGGPIEAEPGELVSTEAMRKVLRDLRQQFQFIVVDSSPILSFAESRAISPLADGVIFVGRSGVTTREAVQRSLELLEAVHSAPVLEVVLNGVSCDSPDYRYQYGY